MTAKTCPNGHLTESSDYCDTCGAPVDQSPSPDAGSRPASGSVPGTAGGSGDGTSSSASAPGGSGGSAASGAATPAAGQPCPNCTLVNTADALFCEACGYDFTTGTMPRATSSTNALDLDTPAAPTAPDPVKPPEQLEWVAEVWVDPDWYADQESNDPCPSPGLPVVVPLRSQSLLIGRRSQSRNIHPEIECSADVGVSRRQAQLTTDGRRWWVEDLQSSNGTYVGAASESLPTEPLKPGQRRELALDDHIYVGAWTCIVVRRATPEEQAEEA